ncbi:PadR family transcriptional regulator [Luteococcus japonicus]|uniref:Transcriptional regulator, PadR family n=1 Tax=Luteococcus japonicus LSP_Lj1 TaxID=1255658 RepID=A0A1R4IX21_9ACTN|nr:PadR family transcriptional regulator [Luteococcus japonicus]SJN24239.1 Transcriptional regulator, PadR family [Luteococcus japonicus LSP_Lj1]
MEDNDQRWPSAWVRAGLDLAILSALQGDALHGYAIASRLEAAGLGRPKGGSLYPTLAKLEQAGFVEAGWLPGESGPGRKAYILTTSGREERTRLAASWRALSEALVALGSSGQPAGTQAQGEGVGR